MFGLVGLIAPRTGAGGPVFPLPMRPMAVATVSEYRESELILSPPEVLAQVQFIRRPGDHSRFSLYRITSTTAGFVCSGPL